MRQAHPRTPPPPGGPVDQSSAESPRTHSPQAFPAIATLRRVNTHHGEVLQDLAHCAHVGVRQELSDAEGEDVLLSPPGTQKTDDNRQEAV